MKAWEYNVTLVLSIGCLILAVWVIVAGRANERLQNRLQVQQGEIDRGNMARQLGSRIVQDMMTVAVTNGEMRKVLEKYGIPQDAVLPKPIKVDKQISPLIKLKGATKGPAGK